MQERYVLMKQLRDHLAELFSLCGMPLQQVSIDPAPAPLRWLEPLLQDKSLYSYLEVLDGQAGQAIQIMKERNLDDWNAQQNELLLQQKEQELEQLSRKLKAVNRAPSVSHAPDDGQLELIRGLIAMRDNLLMRRNWIRDFASGEEAAAKLVEGQLQETATLLERAGVEIMDQTGIFDSRVHTVVETRPAPAPEQAEKIAETFRPGYRFRGEVLRSQEVILYVKA